MNAEPGTPTAPTIAAPTRARRPVLAAHGTLATVGALFFLGSFAYPWTNPEDGTIGAAALPRVAGALLLIIGLALVRQELRTGSVLEGDGGQADDGLAADAPQAAEGRPDATSSSGPHEQASVHRKLITVTLVMVVTALLIPFLGMLPALALMTLFLTAVAERLPWPVALAVSAGGFVGAYLLFVVLLRVPLPFGLFDPAVWSVL
ncbi:tripartite tricarboxylate transporter TctB family protein [Streptomyces jeddahensis]|uniref:Tripartite tricarboxylate transporter TctB family protein n=1 Tax=Streptomyces jeddahensis TaxID=1716141 RepID=A0A177HUW1_9ACTN|nr:tripartite tricarboxylate transporter TctB family protein [Streptomyces jeddahensis]OAH14004.1 tripartite tricarboxylate transporter TctB family protein [Streptomyces jeddahensis]